MSQFATAAELAAFLRQTFDAATIAAADIALQGVTAAIQSHTGQQIDLVVDDEVELAGSWRGELVLPQWPVVDVTSVAVNGTALAAGTWSRAGRTLYRGALLVVNGPDPTDTGTSWAGPLSTVTVTYSHGFAVIPADIKLVCMQAAARLLQNPDGATASETIGAYSYSGATEGAAPLTEAELEMLDRYGTTP